MKCTLLLELKYSIDVLVLTKFSTESFNSDNSGVPSLQAVAKYWLSCPFQSGKGCFGIIPFRKNVLKFSWEWFVFLQSALVLSFFQLHPLCKTICLPALYYMPFCAFKLWADCGRAPMFDMIHLQYHVHLESKIGNKTYSLTNALWHCFDICNFPRIYNQDGDFIHLRALWINFLKNWMSCWMPTLAYYSCKDAVHKEIILCYQFALGISNSLLAHKAFWNNVANAILLLIACLYQEKWATNRYSVLCHRCCNMSVCPCSVPSSLWVQLAQIHSLKVMKNAGKSPWGKQHWRTCMTFIVQ